MKRVYTIVLVVAFAFTNLAGFSQDNIVLPPDYQVDTKIDNMGYWRFCAREGLVPVQPFMPIPAAKYTGSKVLIDGVLVDDSPDVPVTTESSHQSENSIFVNINDKDHVLNSNNSGNWPSTSSFYGSDALDSYDAGLTWGGSVQGAGGSNQGDPVALMNINGRYFINYINNSYGQTCAWSDDNGATWGTAVISNGGIFNILDKNHMWVDNSPTSSFNGHLYCGWMESNNIWVSRSITNGESWESKINISSATSAGSHNQGINFKTGPEGEVYAAWAVYDNWPGDEKAIGFSKSYDGGITWEPAIRALNNIRGIRTTGVSQNQRVNSFPCMAADISNSPYRGHLYIVWPNIGEPGINSGSGCEVYMIKSIDEGETWSDPMRINQDPTGQGKTHYMTWMACDQANGNLYVIWYDNRNLSATETETWMAWSTDGGATWEEMKVSDVSWTPSPIPGMASGYFGDYLAIDGYNSMVYPCWNDNRIGYSMTYVSPISLHIPAALVVYDNNILNDTTYGNGNGKMDYGETILLGLEMINNGDLEASDVTVTLSTTSPYISFEDSTEFFGNFNIGSSITILDAFKYSVDQMIPDGYQVEFQVTATDALDTTTISFFNIEAHAPAVTILGMEIDDAKGNNNQILDPGESAMVKFLTKNTGEYDAEEVISTLTSSNPFVTVDDDLVEIGTLIPNESLYVSFPVTVSESCPYGSATQFLNTASWTIGEDQLLVVAPIGLLVEDWETGNFQKFPWDFCGNADWVIDPDIKWEGNYSARSGDITHEETSGLTIIYNVMYDDSITFYRKVSSERPHDALNFYIDTLLVGSWSWDLDWEYVSFPVMAGSHIFKWEYEKDGQGTQGADHGWVDYIVFPPESKLAVSAGGNGSVCSNGVYQLQGAAQSYDSITWSTSGDGFFDDIHRYDASYTPGTSDIAAGSVTLTITAWGFYGTSVSDAMTLSIDQAPDVFAGNDDQTCSTDPFTLAEATAMNYSTVTWETMGDGTFSDVHELNPTYLAGPLDINAGSVELRLVASGMGACDNVMDNLLLTILPTPEVDLGGDTAICSQLSYTLDATTPDAVSYIWMPGGETTPTIIVDSSGTGIGIKTIAVVVTNSDGCTGGDEVAITFKDCTGINELAARFEVRVFPNPNSGEFVLQIDGFSAETVQLEIINSTGEVVHHGGNMVIDGRSNHSVSVEKLPAGQYFLRLSNEKGMILERLIIQK